MTSWPAFWRTVRLPTIESTEMGPETGDGGGEGAMGPPDGVIV